MIALLVIAVASAAFTFIAGWWGVASVALIAGLAMLAAVIAYARSREISAARRVMRVSLLYLPIIFILLMASGSRPVTP